MKSGHPKRGPRVRWALTVTIAALIAAATLPGVSAAHTVLVDNGFRPTADGFSFPNYGPGAAELSAVELRRLFGPGVCSSQLRGVCALTPPARAVLTQLNTAMAGGHCYGFSVLALGLFKHQFRRLGPGRPYSYRLRNNILLQRTIAYAFSYQTLDSVNRRILAGTPNQVLAHIESALASRGPQTWTLAIFRADGSGGHAVTPFDVLDHGNGKVSVQVYDNNYPGVTREIAFDTTADTWQYNAAANPTVAPELYEGTAAVPAIKLMPTTPGLGVQPCPFCGRSRSGRGEDVIRLTGDPRDHAHLLIRNLGGKAVGLVQGRLINEIPGARIEPALEDDTTLRLEPGYVVPESPAAIAIDGRGLRHVDTETVDVIGPGHDVVLKGLRIGPGQRDLLRLGGGVQRLWLTTGRGRSGSPTLQIGSDGTRADYTLSLRLLRLPGAATLHVAINTRRQLLTIASSAHHARETVVFSVVKQTTAARRSTGQVAFTLRGRRRVLSYSERPTVIRGH